MRLRSPMMAIHTVAAGGGSMLHFDGSRYRVGPESAGANPGPACYRKGGPLTVTDCNVMLGKIQPQFFPQVFGTTGDQPLDAEVVQQQFATLADRNSAGQRRCPIARTSRSGISGDRGRENGRRNQKNLRPARLRHHRLHPLLFRRSRRSARLPDRRKPGHEPDFPSSLRRRSLRLRHGFG